MPGTLPHLSSELFNHLSPNHSSPSPQSTSYSLRFFPTLSTNCEPGHRKNPFPKQADEGTQVHDCNQFLLPLHPVFSCLLMALGTAIFELGSDGACYLDHWVSQVPFLGSPSVSW